MEKRSAYILAKRIINIVYIYEKFERITDCLRFEEIVQKLANIFYIYDKEGKLLNGSSSSDDILKQIADKVVNGTSIVCMNTLRPGCNGCDLEQVYEAVTSINLTYEKHIRNTDMLKTCNTIYFLMTYKFKAKINTDDWEIIY